MRKVQLWICCSMVAALSQFPAQAAIKTWNNASGGSWFTAGSWTPSGYPSSNDTANITMSGTYTVTIDNSSVVVRRLVLGGSSGTQTLRIVAPAQQLCLYRNGYIGTHGSLDIGQTELLLSPEAGSDTLLNSGTILIDSSGNIDLGWDCYLRNLSGGSLLFDDSTAVSAYWIDGFRGYVENSGSITKSGTGPLILFCTYKQLFGGTLSLGSGRMYVWGFTTNGLVTLASGTEMSVGDNEPVAWWAAIDTAGVVELQGTASVSGYGKIENRGEIKHTSAGTSTIAIPYAPMSPPNNGNITVLAGKLVMNAMGNSVDGQITISPLAELEITGNVSSFSSVASTAADSGMLTLNGTTNVDGSFPFSGVLRIVGRSVTFNPQTDPVTLHSFIMEADAEFASSVAIHADSVSMNGGIADADVVVSDHCTWSAGEFVGSGGSIITLDPGTSLNVYGPATKQLDTRDLVIGGTASMSGSGYFVMSGGASIVVDPTGSLTVGDSIGITGSTDSLINHGELTFDCPLDTAIISAFLYNIPSSRTPGTIEILSGKVETESAANFGTVEMTNGAELIVTVLWDNAGLMTVNSGATWKIAGSLQNESSGVIHLLGAAEIVGSGSVSNAGLIDYTGGARSITSTIIGTEFNNLGIDGLLEVVSDTLALTNGGSNSGDMFIHDGAVLRILGTFVNEANGTIRGSGTLDISGASFTNNGTINPGSSPGTMRVIGGLNTQGTINIELAGLSQGTEYDRLFVNGGVTFGGTLRFSLLNGFTPTLADTFRIINYTGYSGEFTAVTGTPVGNGTYMEIAYHPFEIVQYICNGISDIATSAASILDSVHYHRVDTVGLIICNQGHCPLEWTTEFTPFGPGSPEDCPTWEGVGSGGSGLLTRGQCMSLRVAVSGWCLPGTYTSQIRIISNDPDEPLTVIPVQVIVPSIFNIGGAQPDFSGISSAVGYLIDEGVFEPTLFTVFPNSNYGPATIPPILGASAVNTITFRCDYGTAKMRGSNGPALTLDGADHIIFDRVGFENYGTGGTYPYAVWLKNGADSNVIRNARITGATLAGTTTGIYASDADNDYNVFEGDTVANSYYAFYLHGSSGGSRGNEIRHCNIPECVRGVYLYRQSARIHDNDIQPGYTGATPAVCGVYFSLQSANDTTLIYNNRIHNFRGTNNAVGIQITTTSAGVIRAFNNFIYDWHNTGGVVYGIWGAGATRLECNFNSIRIGDAATSSTIAAVNLSSAATQLSLWNNIFEIGEPTSNCWSIYRTAGTLTSNFNCFYGTGAEYYVGMDSITNYRTLTDWKSATGRDLQSRQGNPGFVGAADLHIDPFAGFVDSAGVSLPGITTDIDGDSRAGNPDIGADEYTANHNRVDDLTLSLNIASQSVILRWSPVAGAQSYMIYRSDPAASSIYPSIYVATVTETTYTHTGILSSATHLFYHVTASSTSP